MARISIDYDLMYELARQVWHLRDELDVTSKSKPDFAPADVGPRKQTAEALTHFYGDWRKSFDDAWKVLTDLGNLFDNIGKAFYDADAGVASSAAQQAASLHQAHARNDINAYEQRMTAKRRKVQADDLQRRYLGQENRLKREQAELAKKREALEKKQEALEKRQQELDARNEALDRQQEPLRQRQEELQQKQQDVWRAQSLDRDRQEAALKAEQDDQDAKFKALEKEQEPSRQRQDELQDKQQALWREELELREKQEAAFLAQQAVLQREQDSYDAKQNTLQKRQEALWAERNALLRKKSVTQADLDVWQKKQDALTTEQDNLWKQEGEPLQKKWEDLQKQQRDEQEKAFEPLTRRQQELDKEQQELAKAQEPFEKRQEELLREQKDLWKEHEAKRTGLANEQQKQQDGLDAERAGLSRDQERLQPTADDLQKQQEDLWKDQGANDEAQKELDKEDEALGKRADELQQNKADALEELQKQKPWTPESGEPDPLYIRRGLDPDPEKPPSPVRKVFRQETAQGSTEVTYKLDQNGEIEVDKDGNPIETTTTITNKNGMSYSETFRRLPGEGDSVTTTRSADGSVTKVFVDNDPPGHPAGYTERWVTDGEGNTLQIWGKDPGGDWQLKMDRDTYLDSEAGRQDDQQSLDKPPAYLTVENPLVDGGGRPSGDSSSQGTTTALPDGNTRTDFTRPDGSVLKVVDTQTTRYVADGSNEIQEIWQKRPDGTWYLSDSVTQHTRYGEEPPLGTLGTNWQ
ncbi:hypothetical protein AB0I77_50770 [Streptomyces sp. NPDC050619]|uniref:hypothetical protein n=1 Tax=Streptomyces sp. NPDC050619 TaxID=3157214 RepID=UPI003414B2EF